MKIQWIDFIFYLGFSIIIAAMAYYLAKYVEQNPKILSYYRESGKSIRLFFIRYPWVIVLIIFSIFMLIRLLNS